MTRTTHFSARPGDYNLERNEEQQIIDALEQTGWHHGKAAAMLGISRSLLYRRLRDYNLEGLFARYGSRSR